MTSLFFNRTKNGQAFANFSNIINNYSIIFHLDRNYVFNFSTFKFALLKSIFKFTRN